MVAYPVSLSLRDAAKWYWRVKEWTASVEMSLTAGIYTATYSRDIVVPMRFNTLFSSSDHDYQLADKLLRTTADGLPRNTFEARCYHYQTISDGYDISPGFFDVGGAPSPAVTTYFQLNVFEVVGFITGPHILFNEYDDLSPKLYLSGGMAFSWSDEEDSGDTDFNFDSSDTFETSFDAEIDDNAVPCTRQGGGGATVSIEITATKFWPYANKSGDPVYDEDTGDELVDPFS